MALNFNTDPYYDDFDPNKNFHRILFKPGRAVQARELTQLQTILQNQISNFADAIFAKNTPVSGGKVTLNLKCYYIKLNTQYQGGDIVAADFLNKLITDETGAIVAKVIATAESTGDGGDPPTLIVSYLSGAEFTDGLVVYPIDGTNTLATTIGVAGGTTCSGLSSVASISQGVFYVVNGYNYSTEQNQDGSFSRYSIGNFVTVQPSTIILSKYSTSPTVRIGLIITETYVDYVDSPDLLDPTLGSTNYQAPGADRYVIDLTLTSFPFELANDQNFIELVRVENGIVTKQVDDTVYSKIDDYFAKRTFDTNGDYIVNDFRLGTSSNTANADTFDVDIGKGVAYVRGYRIENQSPLKLTTNRAREYVAQRNNNVYINYGNFLYVNNVAASSIGTFDITDMSQIDIHCVSVANVSSANSNTYNSTVVATSRVRDLNFSYFSNTSIDTSSYVYKMHLFDAATRTLSSNARSIGVNTIAFYDVNGKFSSVNNAYVGATITINNAINTTGTSTSIITAYNGSTKTATFSPSLIVIPSSLPSFTIKFALKDAETVIRANANNYIVASALIDKSSRVGNIDSGDVILQDTTRSELLFPLGNRFIKTLNDKTYQSQKYFRNKSFSSVSGITTLSLTLSSSALNFLGRVVSSGDLSASEITSLFTVIVRNRGSNSSLTNGQILNFTNDANRSISISNDRLTATFVASDLTTPLTVDVIAKVFVSDADNNSIVLRGKNLITAANSSVNYTGTNVAVFTYVDLINGQVYIEKPGIVASGKKQSLFVSDVKRIVKIIDTQLATDVPTNSMLSDETYDVTSYYNFNNGQTDNYYDHATITLKTGAPKARGNLLVLFDYYSPTGGDGYFDVTSYLSPISSSPERYEEIPAYVAKNGTTYILRDCLDFRPTRKNATTAFSFAFSTDQTTTDSGALIPTDLSVFVNDYEYYLPRRDILILSKDRSFQIINGIPSNNPEFPGEPDGSLVLAKFTLDAYTSFVGGENPKGLLPSISLEPVQHKRFTMQDIANMQRRINNIEYYTALNVLEQKAQSTQIPDANGLNRFKNGILVDDFSSFSTADTGNPEFSCSINKRTRELTAQQEVSNFPLQSAIGLLTIGRPVRSLFQVFNIKKTNLYSLPFTTSSLTKQQYATSTVNVNPFAISITEGSLELNPPMDNWVDNTKQPDIVIVDPNLQIFQQSNTVNQLTTGDWKVVPGTTTSTSTSTSSTTFVPGTRTDTTTTTTTTYASKSQTNLMGAYNKIGNTYSINNNFITDISILPYIRAQEISIRASGLKVNSPVTCLFDGQVVNQYISAPDSIELKFCTGKFRENDVIGYTLGGQWISIATVVGVYTYPGTPPSPGTANVRLYVTGNFNSSLDFTSNSIARIYNASFDNNGNYVASTASGAISDTKTVSFHRSGTISAVGSSFVDYLGTTLRYYQVRNSRNGSFGVAYGIWSNTNQRGLTLPAGKFVFTVPNTATYYLKVNTDVGKTGYIKINGTTYWSSGTSATATISLTRGVNHFFEIYVSSTIDNGNAFIAAALSTQPWGGGTSASTSGQVVYSTNGLPTATAVDPSSGVSGVRVAMPGGGFYYTGVTKVALSGIASSISNFYAGSTINFKTIQAITEPDGKINRRLWNSTSEILNYTAANSTVTLATPATLAIGLNSFLGDLTSTYSIIGTETSYRIALQTNKLPQLSTDEAGNFYGMFDVPANTFKTGERVFRIDNRTIVSEPETATCFAEGTFIASGLSTRSQSLEFGASIAGAKNTFTQTKTLNNQLVSQTTSVTNVYSPWDPVAQTFIVSKDNYPNGLFLASISLFFQSKPTRTSEPITLSVVNTLNGFPSGETLDYSIVTLHPNDVEVALPTQNLHYLNPNSATVFEFPAPVYIQAGVLYAFILRSPSTEYNLYIAARDGTIIPSTAKTNFTDANPTGTQKLGTPPYVGALFESQNGITWTEDQTKSLMMEIKRCRFSVGSRNIEFVIPKNLPYRKSSSTAIAYNANPDIVVNTNGSYAAQNVISCAYNITTTDFIPNKTNITYRYDATLTNGDKVGFIPVTPGKFGCPTSEDIYLSDGLGERILMKSRNDSFLLSATLSTSSDTLSPILSDDGLSVYNIEWKVNNLGISNNQIVIVDDGSGYDSNARVTVSAPDLEGGVQAFANVRLFGGNVQSIFVTSAGSGYLNAPTIAVTGPNTNTAIITTTSEFSPSGGNASCRYLTKKVVLAPGNDSRDLRVYYTAYRPIGTNIYVFYKLLSSGDNSDFDDNSWQLMTTTGASKTLFSQNRADIYEFEAAPGINGIEDNYITYVSANGQTFDSFIQFAIKIVITTNDRTTVPVLTSLRAIALPSGTGI